MDLALLVALWLHTVALVIAWGYYGILGRIVLPAVASSLDLTPRARAVAAVEARAVPLVLLAVVLFTATGTYLLVVNPRYAGPGSFFDSTWSLLMLVKHLLVAALVVLGVAIDREIRRAARDLADEDREPRLRRARWLAEGATGVGAAVALLTVAAQLQG